MTEEELPVEVSFDGTKKKKKKKTGDLNLEADVEESAAPAEEVNAAEGQMASLSVDDPSAMFGLKKKKKKPKASAETEEVEEEPADEPAGEKGDEDVEEALNLGLKKKKKKKKDVAADEGDAEAANEKDEEEAEDGMEADENEPPKKSGNPWDGSDRDYKYEELLDRVFGILRENNPELSGEKRRKVLKPPQVLREGTKKTVFVNFIDLCKTMKRQPEHVQAFLLAELGTSGSLDGQQRLIVKGRFLPKVFEGILRRYVNEYVICNMCKSTDTVLSKEQRLFLLRCQACGASRSVSAIKLGFQAQIGRRKKN